MSRVRAVLAAAFVLLAGTTFVAPYRYRGHNWVSSNPMEWDLTGQSYRAPSGITYGPLWHAPSAPLLAAHIGPQYIVDDLTLDAGRMGLWWAAILILAGTTALAVYRPHPTGTG